MAVAVGEQGDDGGLEQPANAVIFTKCVILACKASQIIIIYYFSISNAYAFIENPENQINNTVFNHNC